MSVHVDRPPSFLPVCPPTKQLCQEVTAPLSMDAHCFTFITSNSPVMNCFEHLTICSDSFFPIGWIPRRGICENGGYSYF